MIKDIELLILALTGACNLNCAYCYASNQVEERMPLDIVKASLETLRKDTVIPTVQFTGGEPLLAWDILEEAVSYIESQQIPCKIQIQTNGTLLDAAKAKYIKEHHIAVGISLDGVIAVQEKLRPAKKGPSALATVQGIQYLGAEGVMVGLTTVLTSENISTLEGLIDFAYYLGNIGQIGFNILRPQGKGAALEPPSVEDMRFYMKKALERNEILGQKTGRKIKISQIERIRKLQSGYKAFSHCYALHEKGLYVDPRGDIYSCASLSGNEQWRLGHIQKGLVENKQAQVVEALCETVQYCEACTALPYCGGACYSRRTEDHIVLPVECEYKRICAEAYVKEGDCR